MALLLEQGFECGAISRGLGLWVAPKPLRDASIALRSESGERRQLVREKSCRDAEEPCRPCWMEPDAERPHLPAVSHRNGPFEKTHDNARGLPPRHVGTIQSHRITHVDDDFDVGVGKNHW